MMDKTASLTSLVTRIQERLTALNLTPREASLRTGRGPDALRNIFRAHETGKPYSPRTDTLQLIADALDTTPQWLSGAEEIVTTKSRPRDTPEFFGPRDLPIFSAAEGGPGFLVLDNEPIEYVTRPWYLREIKEGYGVIYTGESMYPRYEQGDILVINPRVPLLRGKPAIFINKKNGEFRATVKILKRRTDKSWHVAQFNPQKEFELDRETWEEAYRVVGTYEGI